MAVQASDRESRPIVADRLAAEWSRWRKLGAAGWFVEIARYLLLIFLAASFSLPFFWMLTSALKVDEQVYVVPPIWIPKPAHWNNFRDAWTSQDFTRYLINTVTRYALPATIGTVFSSAMVAYGLARIRWRGRDLLFSIVLATMMIPPQVTMVPLFITYKHLGWVDTYLPLVVPSFLGSAYFIFMLRQFFMTIPLELADAARIDGASEFGIMWRIILPLSKPALAVVILFRFLGAWNDYFGPLIYVNRKPDWTIALAIEFLRSSMSDIGACPNRYPYLMAVSTLTTVPVVIAFFLAQRTFIEGISLTGLKG